MQWQHGGDIYRNQVKYDFSANINPIGMPDGVLEAAKQGVELSCHYPDGFCEGLREAISQTENVNKDNIIAGSGAAELIYALCNGLKPQKVLIPIPTFAEYRNAANACEAEIMFHAVAGPDYGLQISEDLLYKIDAADIMFLCNPNNPTGRLVEKDVLDTIVKRCEQAGTILCVDECFLPFHEKEAEISVKRYLKEYPHLVIIRAFTKVYGMPGIRLGYLMSYGDEIIEACHKNLPPWNVSLPAQLAGIAALQDKTYLQRTKEYLKEQRDYLLAHLQEQVGNGWIKKIYPTSVNYILLEAETDVDLKAALLKEGILIRDCSNYTGLREGYYRICVGTKEANAYLIEVLNKL